MSDPDFSDRQKRIDSFRPSESSRLDLNRPDPYCPGNQSNPRAHSYKPVQNPNNEMLLELTYLLKSFHDVMRQAKRFFGKYLNAEENHFNSTSNEPPSYKYSSQQQSKPQQDSYNQPNQFQKYHQSEETYERPQHQPYVQPASVKQKKNRWGKKNRDHEDPNKPKAPLTPYFLFFSETRDLLRQKYPQKSLAEIGALGGQIWRHFSQSQRQAYRDRYDKAKIEYRESMKVYNSSGGVLGPRLDYGQRMNVNDF